MRKWAIKRDSGETLAILSGAYIERGFHRSQWNVKDQDGKWVATIYMALHLSIEEIGSLDPPAGSKSSPDGT